MSDKHKVRDEHEGHDVYITSWALSSGIVLAKGYHDPDGRRAIDAEGKPFPCWVILDPWARFSSRLGEAHCFGTLKEAQADVKKRAQKRIKSMREQIKKLQALEPKIIDSRGLERLP